MLTLLFAALVLLTALAVAATVYALFTAEDGYEDQAGFHHGAPQAPVASSLASVPRAPRTEHRRRLHRMTVLR